MLRQVIALAAICCCLTTVTDGRSPQLDGFIAILNNGIEVRASRDVTIAMKVTGGQGQASTRTSNGRIIVEMNYINGSQLDSCKIIYGRYKLRHFYRKFLNHAPFSAAVQKALQNAHKQGRNSTAHVEVVKAVTSQGARVLTGVQRWTGATMRQYGPMTNHWRVVSECRMWRKEYVPAARNVTVRPDTSIEEDEADEDEEDFEDEDEEDEEGDFSDSSSKDIDMPSDFRNTISVVGRRNTTTSTNHRINSDRRNASGYDNAYIMPSVKRNATGFERRFNMSGIGRRNSTGFDRRNMTDAETRDFIIVDRSNGPIVNREDLLSALNARNGTGNDKVKYLPVVNETRHTSVTNRRFGEVAGRWNATGVDRSGRKNITIKLNRGRSKRHNMRRGLQHHGFIAVQASDASLPSTSEVRAARHGKLAMQTHVTTRDHNGFTITETTNGQAIVKTVTRDGEGDVEDCDIIRGPIKMRKFYRKFLDDAPLGPAVVRATARRRYQVHGEPNGTHPHQHRHHSTKVVVNKVTNRAWQSLNDSAQSWNDTLLDEYGQMVSFRKQMRKCKQWRKEHGKPHHLTNQTADASFSSQSDEEQAGHVTEGGRVKRQLYAGTKWCGAGSSTADEKDMGHHREVDKCCQKHDECPYNIEAFTTKWGLFNHRLTTISLCECDFRFRTCLRNVGTETADSVGYIFFEVVSPTCFNFRYEDVCVERTWYGKCTRTERQPKAVSRESLSFN